MNKICCLFFFLTTLIIPCCGQQTPVAEENGWKMQPIQLQSRWAKEVSPSNALKEYPRPQMMRKNWQNLNGLWEYAITTKDANKPTEFEGKILVPYPLESALSGVQRSLTPDQNLWYKRNVQRPDLSLGERILLHFGAVDWQATVFINDKEVGQHYGGYQCFDIDITDYLKTGPNELMVKVYDPTDKGLNPHGKQTLNPANIYYTPSSGIWQTVWLERVPKTYIATLKTTPDIDKAILNVNVNASETIPNFKLVVTAKANGKIVGIINGSPGTNMQLHIQDVHLWSPEDPFLYDLSIKIIKGRKVIDQVESYFGMRKIAIEKDGKGTDRIFLNNKPYYNLGVLDQGFWPDGLYTAPTDEALAFDIKAIKAMGFNTIRKHIKIEPARWYYHADKVGMLVWQDFVNPPQDLPEGARAEFESESREILDQLHNYPSIITWVLFNEGWGAYDQKRLTEWVRQYDSSRLVDGHSGELLYVNGELRAPADSPWVSSEMTDIHSYPNPMMAPAQSGKARVLGEFGGVGVAVPGHEWNDLQGWGYIQVTPSELESRYEMMIRRLKNLEEEGLSGSIYTQPFDVEGEENGLLTYDREIIKIPVKLLWEINQPLTQQAGALALDSTFNLAKNIDIKDNDSQYAEYLDEYKNGERDSAFLRRLTLMAIRQKDQSNVTLVGDTYISGLNCPYSKGNLTFINHITRTSKDSGFKMFLLASDKVNVALGNYIAQRKVEEIISNEEIAPYLQGDSSPIWDTIEKRVISKYGALGAEKVWGARMTYSMDRQDWQNFGKYYILYFKMAVTHSEYHINNMSWVVFEHVSDPEVLEAAIRADRYSMETFAPNDPIDIDTYANLLYKSGKKDEAIKWEEKAVKLSNNEKEFVETLEKMKKNQPTWVRL